MITELRIYYMHPNKMDAICNRFDSITLKLFPKHGITVGDFWVDAQGKEILYYTCIFDSIDARDAAWKSLQSDPDWMAAKAKSEESGPLVAKVESYLMEDAPFFKRGEANA